MNPTCFFTGKKDNLLMYAHRNNNGDMVGWVFVHDSVDMLKELHLQIVDPRDPLAEAWNSEEDKIWDTLDMPHTFKVGDRVRVVSYAASTANELCAIHGFSIGDEITLTYWHKGSSSWEAKGVGTDIWNIDPADIEPIK